MVTTQHLRGFGLAYTTKLVIIILVISLTSLLRFFTGRFPPGRSGRAFFGVCLASFTRRSGAICFTTGFRHVARCVDIRVFLFVFCCRRQLFQQHIHIGLPVYEGRDWRGLLTFGRCRKDWSNVNKLRVDNGGGMAAKAPLVTKAVPAACDAVSQLAHLKTTRGGVQMLLLSCVIELNHRLCLKLEKFRIFGGAVLKAWQTWAPSWNPCLHVYIYICDYIILRRDIWNNNIKSINCPRWDISCFSEWFLCHEKFFQQCN